jgi:hypothetical protein
MGPAEARHRPVSQKRKAVGQECVQIIEHFRGEFADRLEKPVPGKYLLKLIGQEGRRLAAHFFLRLV